MASTYTRITCSEDISGIGFEHVLTGGCFLKWWYPTTIGFPTKNDHFGVFWGYHHFRKHPGPSSLLVHVSSRQLLPPGNSISSPAESAGGRCTCGAGT